MVIARVALVALACATPGCALVAGLNDFSGQAGAPSGGGGTAAMGGAPSGGEAPSGGGGAGSGGAPACAADVILSEVRTHGSAGKSDDFIEIVNPTAKVVSLDGVQITAGPPGGSQDPRFTGVAGDSLAPGERLVIVGSGFNDVAADFLMLGNSLGDDQIVILTRDLLPIDRVCTCESDCTNPGFSVCEQVAPNPCIDGAQGCIDIDKSLQREPECAKGVWNRRDSTPGDIP